MNELFGNIPGVGTLTMTEIYSFYEEPLTFLCVNELKQSYLLMAIGDGNKEQWLLTPISYERLIQMKLNQITLYDVWTKSETGQVCYITKNTYIFTVEWKYSPEILAEDLPLQDNYLDLPKDSEYTGDIQKTLIISDVDKMWFTDDKDKLKFITNFLQKLQLSDVEKRTLIANL